MNDTNISNTFPKEIRIAVSGKARSGKDTTCDYLIDKINNITKLTFATPLYDCLYSCQDILELDRKKDRNFLQTVGDWARNINIDIFANIAEHKIQRLSNIIVSDLRFPNEYEMLKRNNFILIRVHRDTDESVEGSLNNLQQQHQSEVLLDNHEFDYYINNDGTIEELYKKIDNIIEEIIM